MYDNTRIVSFIRWIDCTGLYIVINYCLKYDFFLLLLSTVYSILQQYSSYIYNIQYICYIYIA